MGGGNADPSKSPLFSGMSGGDVLNRIAPGAGNLVNVGSNAANGKDIPTVSDQLNGLMPGLGNTLGNGTANSGLPSPGGHDNPNDPKSVPYQQNQEQQKILKDQQDASAANDLAAKQARQNEADTFTKSMKGGRDTATMQQSLQGLQDQARKVRGRSLFGS